MAVLVAFRGKGAPGRIFLVTNLTGPGEPKTRELTTQKTYQDSWPHFSPDGTKLLFTRATEPHRDLQFGDVWVLDLKTGRETQLTDTPDVAEQGLGWCPFDGRIYIYESPQDRGQVGSIVRLTEDGSSERFPCELAPSAASPGRIPARGLTASRPCRAKR